MLVRSVSNRWLRLLVATCLMLSVASAGVERAEVLETEVWPQERNVHINVHDEEEINSRQKRQATERQPIRITTFLDPTTINPLTADKRNMVDRLLRDAVTYFESTYSVNPVPRPILLQRRCTGGIFFPALTNKTQIACANGCSSVTTCGANIPVPSDHLNACYSCNSQGNNCALSNSAGAGVANSDLVIYVGAYTGGQCTGDTVAYASSCAQEDLLDRPVVGYVNICASKLTSSANYASLQGTMRHEIYHILVFSPGLYAYYRDANGTPRTSRVMNGASAGLPSLGYITATTLGFSYGDKVNYQWSTGTVRSAVLSPWVTATSVNTLSTYYMVTPKVREFVRNHFNCTDLEGAMLENQGGTGTALTHWEKRVFQDDVMTGTSSQNQVFSGLTLALMEDSGWYNVNYTNADALVWGLNAGCEFVRNSCGSWMTSRVSSGNVLPYCLVQPNADRRFFCNVDHSARAICSLSTYTSSLPNSYQYFTSTLLPNVDAALLDNTGGSITISDFCPSFVAFRDSSTMLRSECDSSSNQPPSPVALDFYGTGSRCILHNSPWSARSASGSTTSQVSYGSGCYKVACNATGQRVVVQVSSTSVDCTGRAGAVVQLSIVQGTTTHMGSIICPDYMSTCFSASNQGSTRFTSDAPTTQSGTVRQGATTTNSVVTTTASSASVLLPSMTVIMAMMASLLY